MSSLSIQSESTDKRVKTPVENSGSKSDCEVSSSSKVSESSALDGRKDRAKENTESSSDNAKSDTKSAENKMSSDSTSRNPLTESALIPPNNETNRRSHNATENKTPKMPANTPNEANNNNNPKLRTRLGKKSTSPTRMSACGWCSDNKPILKYILPTLSGENLQFCSEMCIAEFRKAVKKGACKQCGNVVRPAFAPNKEFCSSYCMNKAMPKNGKIPSEVNKSDCDSCNYLCVLGMDDVSSTTNINGNAKKSPNGNYSLARSFQYETFHVFNWDDYLVVSVFCFD